MLVPLPSAVAKAMGVRTVIAVDADAHAPHRLRDTLLGSAARWTLHALHRSPRDPPTRRWVLCRLDDQIAGVPRRTPSADVLIQPTYGGMTANDLHRGRHCSTRRDLRDARPCRA